LRTPAERPPRTGLPARARGRARGLGAGGPRAPALRVTGDRRRAHACRTRRRRGLTCSVEATCPHTPRRSLRSVVGRMVFYWPGCVLPGTGGGAVLLSPDRHGRNWRSGGSTGTRRCTAAAHSPQKKTSRRGFLFFQPGVPGATAGKCAVSPLVQNITLLPGGWRVRNAWKINARIKANVRGVLTTLG
jgi:hypothetical protein